MKLKLLTTGILMLALTSCWNSHDIAIKVEDSKDTYKFSASFNRSKTPQVERVINKFIAPTHVESDNGLDFTTMLDDRTALDIESSPGEVMIKMDKTGHNQVSYMRVKSMCEAIKEVISEKKK
ncbi:hypothetical protein [Dyadobacter pollutisoli]|uniref:Lipoprotein n=1 Tax=Dyadobacter pollutisoli TaxID=2910158 RepID=A0A9E8NHT9_9BACT|nr:hypothetical protein [Dyadobacter pollutisoli]WAC14547.1 hypothetical protein ON006_11425 [Dyadobacter pollutisoli]